MLTLVPWLLERPGSKVADTAAVFATDEATIRRELEHLDYCGLPGLGGGALFDVSIVDDRITVRMADELRYPLRPSPPEALRLLLIATAAQRVAGEELPLLQSALQKLHHALGVPEAAIEVLEAEPDDLVDHLRAAIRREERVSFEYRGRSDMSPRRREVEPWAVELREGAWYLHGLDVEHRQARVFRLDRAAGLQATGIPRSHEVPAVLEPPTYRPQDDDLLVEILFTRSARWLLDALTHEMVEEIDNDRFRVLLRTRSIEWIARLVLMCGGDAEVVAPLEVRERVRSLAQDALDRLG